MRDYSKPIDYAAKYGQDHIKPFHHTAMLNGFRVTFVNLEYAANKPPKVIEIDGMQWVRRDA